MAKCLLDGPTNTKIGSPCAYCGSTRKYLSTGGCCDCIKGKPIENRRTFDKHDIILAYKLRKDHKMTYEELVSKFEISKATLARYFKKIDERGLENIIGEENGKA